MQWQHEQTSSFQMTGDNIKFNLSNQPLNFTLVVVVLYRLFFYKLRETLHFHITV